MNGAEPTPLRRNRDFTLLQLGQGLSTLGAQTSAIAYPLLVLALTGSPAKAGLVGFARLIPYPVFVLVAGVVVDRLDRRRVMIVADVVRLVAVATIVAGLWLGNLGLTQIAIVAFVEGTAFAFFNIAEIGALRAVVATRQLPAAAAVEQARLSSVVLAGPPLGGFLFGLGRSVPFLVDAISYLFSLASIVAMRTPFQEARVEPRQRIRRDVAEGFAWLWRQAFLRTCALLFAASNFAWEALFLLFVVTARAQGLASGEIGVLIAVFGGASLLGSLLAPRMQRLLSMRTIVVGNLWLGLGVLAFVVEPSVYVLLAGAIPAALLGPTLNATIIGYRVAVTPDRLQGRVTSVARLLSFSAAPLGPLAAGLLLESYSPRQTVAVLGLWFAAIAAFASFSRPMRDAPSLSELSPTA
ncbi:MAG: MFS transporter [Gaiellaceae bacterium]